MGSSSDGGGVGISSSEQAINDAANGATWKALNAVPTMRIKSSSQKSPGWHLHIQAYGLIDESSDGRQWLRSQPMALMPSSPVSRRTIILRCPPSITNFRRATFDDPIIVDGLRCHGSRTDTILTYLHTYLITYFCHVTYLLPLVTYVLTYLLPCYVRRSDTACCCCTNQLMLHNIHTPNYCCTNYLRRYAKLQTDGFSEPDLYPSVRDIPALRLTLCHWFTSLSSTGQMC